MAAVHNGLLGLLLSPWCLLLAQDSLIVRTNYYTMFGSTDREVREAIERKRPWKQPGDGFTLWKIQIENLRYGCGSSTLMRALRIWTCWSPRLSSWKPIWPVRGR